MHPDSVKYTGFAVPGRGIYVWTVTPFGMKVSPTHFQKCIEIALRDLIDNESVRVYIDDIVLATNTTDDHLQLLKKVFDRLREAGFYINIDKAHILRLKVELLGHIISLNKLQPDPKKVQGIVDAQAPQDKPAVKSFVAAASFLRSYIPNFSEIVAPLTDLTKDRVRFVWDKAHEVAFDRVKQAMLDATYLVLPNFSEPFHVYVDASEIAVGASLCQFINNEKLWIAFASKKLNDGQTKWSTTEREVYSIVFGCERFERYIKGCKAVIHSDHAALTYLRNATSPKLKRWALRLLEFGHEITFVPGDDNVMADWLSRSRDLQEEELPAYAYVPLVYYLSHDPEGLPPCVPNPDEMAVEAKLDEANQVCAPLKWLNGVAYQPGSNKLYIPFKFRDDVVKWFHGSRYGGHQGVRKTEMRIKKYVWWPGIRINVEKVISNCPLCNFFKTLSVNKTIKGVLNRPTLFEVVSIDFIGPRRVFNSNWNILVLVDHCSRFMVTAACPSQSSSIVIDTIKQKWLPSFGSPGAILSDHGSAFTSKEYTDFVVCDLRSSIIYASIQYPQGNAMNESSHRILESAIRCSPQWESSDFASLVSEATLVYNASPNVSIGDSPSSFLYGCDPCLPGLEPFYVSLSDEARRVVLKDRRMWILLKEIGEDSSNSPTSNELDEFSPGDIITKKLTESDKSRYIHLSGSNQYQARRSLPYRVLKVKQGSLIITPLFVNAPSIVVPKAECKKITGLFDRQLCFEAAKLFPKIREDLLQLPLRPSPAPTLSDPPIIPADKSTASTFKKEVRFKRARGESFEDLFR